MHPVLLKIFGVEFISYGVALGFSFIILVFLSALRARKEGFEPLFVIDAFLWFFIGAILGSRVYGIFSKPVNFLLDPFYFIKFWKGGFSSIGGFLGGFLILIIFLRIKKKPVLKFFDLISPYFGLGFAIQKFFGCLMAGCCYGKPTNTFLGITFENIRSSVPVEFLGIPLHPVQIYEGILGLLIFLILISIRNKKIQVSDTTQSDQSGRITFLFLILFSGGRFLTGFFRGDQAHNIIEIFSFSQILFAMVFFLASAFYFLNKNINPLKN